MESGGFWSYAHADNDAEGGRIVRLADLIKREYGLLTGGDEIAIFVDRDIQWGEEWRRRIARNLAEVTFFIPIITPGYFRSQECRRELLQFAGHAASLGVGELLLPLLYINVPGLAEGSDDEAMALVAGTQYVDWRSLRLEPEDSAPYRRAVNGLAERLRDIAEVIGERPEAPPVATFAEATDGNDELGILDSTALAEELAPLLGGSLGELGDIGWEMQPIIQEGVERISRAQATSAKLAAARWLAASIKDPSERFEAAAERYAGHAVAMDPAILRMIRGASEVEEGGDLSEYASLFSAIHGAAQSLRGFAGVAGDLREGVQSMSRLTRVLQPTVRTLSRGARKIQDAQAVVDEWDRQIVDSGLLPLDDLPGDSN